MNRARRRAVATIAGAGLLLVTGCATTRPVTPIDTPTIPAATVSAGPVPTVPGPGADLVARREAAGIAACPAPGSAPAVAGGLPGIATRCLDGSSTVDLSTLRGTPMVVNLWATWCGPCRAEAPFLAEVSQQSGAAVRFIGVDVADPDPAAALDFAGARGWSYAQVADPDRTLSAGLGVVGIPQTLFVDADGRIVHRHAGALTSADQLRGLIHDHLGID